MVNGLKILPGGCLSSGRTMLQQWGPGGGVRRVLLAPEGCLDLVGGLA